MSIADVPSGRIDASLAADFRDSNNFGSELNRLVALIAKHDSIAFASFYDLTSPWVFGLVQSVVEPPDDPQDVTIRVYLRVWQTAASFTPHQQEPLTWALRIARMEALPKHNR